MLRDFGSSAAARSVPLWLKSDATKTSMISRANPPELIWKRRRRPVKHIRKKPINTYNTQVRTWWLYFSTVAWGGVHPEIKSQGMFGNNQKRIRVYQIQGVQTDCCLTKSAASFGISAHLIERGLATFLHANGGLIKSALPARFVCTRSK